MDTALLRLLGRYVNNECTKEELLRVHELLIKGISEEVWQQVMDENQERNDFSPLPVSHKNQLFSSITDKLNAAPMHTIVPAAGNSNWAYRIAASLLLLIGVGFGAYYFIYSSETIETITGLQHQHLKADDGSEIWMNNKSKLSYPTEFSNEQRLVNLEGEAFFEVAKEKNRPFIITTQDVRIQVLGTSFNVKSYKEEEEIIISLATGRVEVDVQGVKQILSPGEELHYNKSSHHFQRVSFNTEEASAWREGWMVFNSTRLGDVVKTAERQYGIHVLLKGVAMENKITLKVKERGLESLFQILSYSAELDYQIKGDSVILEPKHN